MRWTETLIPTLKESPADADVASHKLMLRAGLIRKLASGAYTYMPLGLKVLRKIENIVREEMDKTGALELLMPALQPIELWKESGRYETFGEDLIIFKDRHKKEVILGPTHEEVITDIARNNISSYKQLPITLYQIQTKYRDEVRPRFGILRSREFIMKDAYSFDIDKQGLDQSYKKMFDAYSAIFERCGLKTIPVEADSGSMGGDESCEFMAAADSGEDMLAYCKKCGYGTSLDLKVMTEKDNCPDCGQTIEIQHAIEIGHIFKLGTKYSNSLGAKILDKDGNEKVIVMGCYGIGINRIMASIIEQNNDKNGIIWLPAIAPYQVIILPLNVSNKEVMDLSENIYEELKAQEFDVLMDDRDERAGFKFKDADLTGIPIKVIVGEKRLTDNKVEIKNRKTGEIVLSAGDKVADTVKKMLDTF